MGNSTSTHMPCHGNYSRGKTGHQGSPALGARRRRNASLFTISLPPSTTIRSPDRAPPPPYSAAVSSPSSAPAFGSSHTRIYDHSSPRRDESTENALEMLRKYNTVIVVDDSLSMSGRLWREARDALASLAQTASKYDDDGIDIHFLNDRSVGSNMKSSASIHRLFDTVQPRGATPIGEKLEELLLEYLSLLDHAQDSGNSIVLKSIKPINYIIITDGAPTDDPEAVILAAAKRLDARNYPLTQVGIQFVQIGNSRNARDYLNELDDALASSNGIRDMVDTTPYSGGPLSSETLVKILLGGINRRVDRRGAASIL